MKLSEAKIMKTSNQVIQGIRGTYSVCNSDSDMPIVVEMSLGSSGPVSEPLPSVFRDLSVQAISLGCSHIIFSLNFVHLLFQSLFWMSFLSLVLCCHFVTSSILLVKARL